MKDEYPIHVIRGNRIPWEVWYSDQLVLEEEDGESYFDEKTNITYLIQSKAEVFLPGLPKKFPSHLERELFALALSSRIKTEDEPDTQRKSYTAQFECMIGEMS